MHAPVDPSPASALGAIHLAIEHSKRVIKPRGMPNKFSGAKGIYTLRTLGPVDLKPNPITGFPRLMHELTPNFNCFHIHYNLFASWYNTTRQDDRRYHQRTSAEPSRI
jgi:hypothetical protein